MFVQLKEVEYPLLQFHYENPDEQPYWKHLKLNFMAIFTILVFAKHYKILDDSTSSREKRENETRMAWRELIAVYGRTWAVSNPFTF